MPKKTRKPHVIDTLNTITVALEKAKAMACDKRSNPDLKIACLLGSSDLIRTFRFLENLSDWGKI